jgi:hypothetical protein
MALNWQSYNLYDSSPVMIKESNKNSPCYSIDFIWSHKRDQHFNRKYFATVIHWLTITISFFFLISYLCMYQVFSFFSQCLWERLTSLGFFGLVLSVLFCHRHTCAVVILFLTISYLAVRTTVIQNFVIQERRMIDITSNTFFKYAQYTEYFLLRHRESFFLLR